MMAFSSHLCANNYVCFSLYNVSKHIVFIACLDSITGEYSNLRIWITLNKFFMKPLDTWSNRAQAVCLFTRRTGIGYGLANPTEMTLNAASQLMGYQK